MEDEKRTDMPVREEKLTSMRRVIGQRMQESLTGTAQYTLTREIDVDALLDYVRVLRETDGDVKLMHVLIKAAATLLKEHEKLNASITDKGIVYHDYVNMGVAVALPEGLLVPVLKNVDGCTVGQIAQMYAALIPKARTGRIPYRDISGGTFTISNLGMAGIDAFTPIINYPEAAILGVGRTREGLVMEPDGALKNRKSIIFSLTLDHRLVDGYVGAQFLDALARTLSDEEQLRAAVG